MAWLNPVNIRARDLGDSWFQAVDMILSEGRQWTIERGSYEGQKRWELDWVQIHITHPHDGPLLPEMPSHLSHIPPPTTMDYVCDYLPYLMEDQPLKPNEEYNYGSRIKPQMDAIIERYKKGFGSNQECISVARPEDTKLPDPPCLPGDSYIVTQSGVQTLDTVAVGEFVYTHKGRLREILEVYQRPYQGEMNYITLMGNARNVCLTPEHPVWAVRAQACPYDSHLMCKPCCKKRYSVYEKNGKKCPAPCDDYVPGFVPASEITRYHFVAVPRVRDKKNQERKYSKEELYVWGLFVAQGWFSKAYGICLAIDKNKQDVSDRLSESMKKVYGLEAHIDENYVGCNRLSFYSKKLASEYLKRFGKGARTKNITEQVQELTVAEAEDFLKGWVAGDGWIDADRGRRQLCTTSPYLKESAEFILTKLGISSSVSKVKIKDSIIDGRVIKANGPAYSFNWTPEPKNRIWWSDTDYVYVPVRSNLVIPYNGLVYNLEVAEDNSYIASGTPVHNCLRSIDTRIIAKDGRKTGEPDHLHFFPYFRSNDLWNGFPANMAAIALMQQWMAQQIGVLPGEIIYTSKGVHLYGFTWDIARLRTGSR